MNLLKNMLGSAPAQGGLLGSQAGKIGALSPLEFAQMAQPAVPARRDDLHMLRDVKTGRFTNYAKLAMRMGWMDVNPGNLGVPAAIDHVEVAETAEGYVVFLVVKGKPMMIEDGDLFPSDTLVTKLRMIGGE